jgi:hypothetical protein
VPGYCEHGNELSSFVKSDELIEQLNDITFEGKTAPWRQLDKYPLQSFYPFIRSLVHCYPFLSGGLFATLYSVTDF